MFERKDSNKLSNDDILMLAMMNLPHGALGEHIIHEMVSTIIQAEPFEMFRDVFAFEDLNGIPFSDTLHDVILENCKDVSNVNGLMDSKSKTSASLFCDTPRFEAYDRVKSIEQVYEGRVKDNSPKIFFFTASGRSVAIESLTHKMNREQKRLIKYMMKR